MSVEHKEDKPPNTNEKPALNTGLINYDDISNDYYTDLDVNVQNKIEALKNNRVHTSPIIFKYCETLNARLGQREEPEKSAFSKFIQDRIAGKTEDKEKEIREKKEENSLNGIRRIPKNSWTWLLDEQRPEPTKWQKTYPLYYKIIKTESRLVRTLFERHGFVEENGFDWNVMWSGAHPKPYIFQNLNQYQKINHFPRAYEITRKNHMYKNIIRMQELHGKENFDIVPKTFIMPEEYEQFCDACKKMEGHMWICKPYALSRGRGIRMITEPDEALKSEECVVSDYLKNPFLINGKKFDLRIYVAVTSFDPLRIYVYEEGLARFASEKFSADLSNINNEYVHLTNYSVNKNSNKFVGNVDPDKDDIGNKWTLSALRKHLESLGIDHKKLWEKIHDLIIKSIVSVESYINAAARVFVPFRGNCYELYGFDILLDENLKPWLLEINLTPSLGCDAPIDHKVKCHMMAELFTMLGVRAFDKLAYKEKLRNIPFNPMSTRINRISSRYKRKKTKMTKEELIEQCSQFTKRKEYSNVDFNGLTLEEKLILKETIDENNRRGKWVRVFPAENLQDYLPFIENNRYNILIANRLFNMKIDKQYYNTVNKKDTKEISAIEYRTLELKKLATNQIIPDEITEENKNHPTCLSKKTENASEKKDISTN